MPAADEINKVVSEWVRKADNDLMNATHTLRLGARGPTDTVGFHAQQCIEKYLKALLTWKSIEFPRTHDIEILVALLPTRARPNLNAEEQRRLTDYATVTRYPGEYDAVSLAEARHAVSIARRVRAGIRRFLPRSAIRKGKT